MEPTSVRPFNFQLSRDENDIDKLEAFCNEVLYSAPATAFSQKLRASAEHVMAKLQQLRGQKASYTELLSFATKSLSQLHSLSSEQQATQQLFRQQTADFNQQSQNVLAGLQASSLMQKQLQRPVANPYAQIAGQLTQKNLTSSQESSNSPQKPSNYSMSSYYKFKELERQGIANAANSVINNISNALKSSPGAPEPSSYSWSNYPKFKELERQGVASGAASVASHADAAIEEYVSDAGANIKRHASAICNKNPQIKANCQAILDFSNRARQVASNAMDAVAKLPIVKKVNEKIANIKIRPGGSGLPEQNERLYGIPQASTQEYLNNIAVVGGFALSNMMPGGKPLKLAKNQLRAGNAAAGIAEKASRLEKVNLRAMPQANHTPFLKKIKWLGASKQEFMDFPREVISDMGHALLIVQKGGLNQNCKPVKNFFGGKPIYEVFINNAQGSYRTFYTFDEEVVKIVSAFKKNSSAGVKTSHRHIETAKLRLKMDAK